MEATMPSWRLASMHGRTPHSFGSCCEYSLSCRTVVAVVVIVVVVVVSTSISIRISIQDKY